MVALNKQLGIKYVLFACVWFIFLSIKSVAQPFSVKINGSIKALNDSSINNAYVKISSNKSKMILAYFNTANKIYFFTSVNCKEADSLNITVTHIAYETYSKNFFVNALKDSLSITISMVPKTNTLNEVTVNAPPIWVRGDTTFFRMNAFKEGDERKLNEVLVKMPGFEMDENGNLLYKKRRVEKVMVDGDDIFADKVKLLINNFPIHVIENVQLLENQNSNPLFKGIVNENKVFINLELQKSKVKTAFGNGEFGIGTLKRYLFKPVIFSIYNKLKIAYIGNANTVGDGIGWREDLEQKPEQMQHNTNWIMNDLGFSMIPNFNYTRYINTKRWSNNVQINLPSKKKVKKQIELSSITDNQSQFTYNQSSILSNNTFISRVDTNLIHHKPLLLSAKYILEKSFNENSLLKSRVHYFFNGTTSNQFSIYKYQNSTNNTDNTIKNKWSYINVNTEFTQRKSKNKIIKYQFNYYTQFNPQNGVGFSNDWQNLFQLNDTYNQLMQNLNFKSNFVDVSWMSTKKRGRITKTVVFNFNWKQYSLQNKLSFKNLTKDTTLNNFTNSSLSNIYSFTTQYNYSFKLGKLPIDNTNELGLLYFNSKEMPLSSTNFYPTFKFELSSRNNIYKFVENITSIIFEQKSNDNSNLISFVRPTSIINFRKYINGGKPLYNFKMNTGFSAAWVVGKSLNFTNFLFTYNKDFRSSISNYAVNGLLYFTLDSLFNKPINSYSINTTTTINSLKNKNIYTITYGYDRGENFINHQSGIIKTNFNFTYILATSKIHINKFYYIASNVKFFNSTIKFPTQSLKSNVNQVNSLIIELKQRFKLAKNANLILQTDYYNNDMGNHSLSKLYFIDVEFNLGIPKKHVFFYLKAENLLNKNAYNNSALSAISQSINQIPLIAANIMFTVKYEL
jgi:hypothetical protein